MAVVERTIDILGDETFTAVILGKRMPAGYPVDIYDDDVTVLKTYALGYCSGIETAMSGVQNHDPEVLRLFHNGLALHRSAHIPAKQDQTRKQQQRSYKFQFLTHKNIPRTHNQCNICAPEDIYSLFN